MRRKTPAFSPDVNSYVESFKKIHCLVILLTFLTFFAASKIYNKQTLNEKLKVLDMVFALDDIISSENKWQKMKSADIAKVSENYEFSFVNNTKLKESIDGKKTDHSSFTPSEKYAEQLLNSENQLSNSFINSDKLFFSSPARICSIGLYGGSTNTLIPLVSNYYKSGIFKSYPREIYLINFSPRCVEQGWQEERMKTALLIKAYQLSCKQNCQPTWFVGLSKSDKSKLQINHLPTFDLDFVNLDLFKKYRNYESKFISYKDTYSPYRIDFLKGLVFDAASYEKDKIYRPEEMKKALEDLFYSERKQTNFLGIDFDEYTLMRFAPFFLIILLYELYRRIIVIRKNLHQITVPWIFVGVDSIIDIGIVFIAHLTPIACFLAINFLSLDSQGATWMDFFGHQVSIRNILEWHFPETPPRGWWKVDVWSSILLTPLLLLSCFFVYKIQKALLVIILSKNRLKHHT